MLPQIFTTIFKSYRIISRPLQADEVIKAISIRISDFSEL